MKTSNKVSIVFLAIVAVGLLFISVNQRKEIEAGAAATGEISAELNAAVAAQAASAEETATLKTEVADLTAMLAEADAKAAEVEAANEALAALQGDLDAANAEIEAMRDNITTAAASSAAELEAAWADMATLREERDALQDWNDEISATLSTMKDVADALNAELVETRARVVELEAAASN